MTVSPRIAALAAVVALVVAAPSVAAAPAVAAEAQPAVLSVERYETPIDGWGGWLAWSRRAPDGGYTLIARNPAGDAVSLPVAPQPTPIDASIGPGPDGRPLIVYSRCRGTGSQPTGCDVHRLDPATGLGGRVAAASRSNREERYPTVWGTKIAFSLSLGKSPSRAGIAVADLNRTTPVSRPAVFGPRTERINGRTGPLRQYGPRGIDLRGGRLAFSWQGQGRGDWWSLQTVGTAKSASPRRLFATQTTSSVVSQIGRPVLGAKDVIAPVLRTGGWNLSEIVRTSLDGRQRWTLPSGFTAAQTEQYGSALTAVARTDDRDLVIVRRLASDGRWACVAPSSAPAPGGCELLRYADATDAWTRVTTASPVAGGAAVAGRSARR